MLVTRNRRITKKRNKQLGLLWYLSNNSELLSYSIIFSVFIGMLGRRVWWARGRKIYRLYLEDCLHLFRVRERILLQAHYPTLWYVYSPVVGLRLRHDRRLARLVLDALYARLHDLYWLLAEDIHQHHRLLSWADMSGVWYVPEPNSDQENVTLQLQQTQGFAECFKHQTNTIRKATFVIVMLGEVPFWQELMLTAT